MSDSPQDPLKAASPTQALLRALLLAVQGKPVTAMAGDPPKSHVCRVEWSGDDMVVRHVPDGVPSDGVPSSTPSGRSSPSSAPTTITVTTDASAQARADADKEVVA